MNRGVPIVFLLLLPIVIFSHSSHVDVYISTYKELAISEMKRTGIPASIKMAQAMLESDWGRSTLAIEANNHFGIKCGNKWEGDTFYLKDDDRDSKGKIIPSCFRVFPSVEASFIAHSEFLLNNGRASRYDFLFELDKGDYKGWAYGLKKAGYATDKKYPHKLIKLIEDHQLYLLDEYSSREQEFFTSADIPAPETESIITKKDENKSDYKVRDYTFSKVNNVRATFALGGETLQELANRTGFSLEKVIEHNEGYGHGEITLEAGEIIYLDRKKRSFKGSKEFHIVQHDEDMFSISQLYGIKLVNLYAKNKMPKGSQPLVGEKLYLKKTCPGDDRPSYSKHPGRDEDVTFLFEEEGVVVR